MNFFLKISKKATEKILSAKISEFGDETFSIFHPLPHLLFFQNGPTPASLMFIFVIFNNNLTANLYLDFSRIWARIVIVEGEQVDHLTTTTISLSYYLTFSLSHCVCLSVCLSLSYLQYSNVRNNFYQLLTSLMRHIPSFKLHRNRGFSPTQFKCYFVYSKRLKWVKVTYLVLYFLKRTHVQIQY